MIILFLTIIFIQYSDEYASTSNKDQKIYLTPEMVNVQFNIPNIFEAKEKNFREE